MAPPFQASLDRLLEHVLNEIAIEGPQGITTKQFQNFVAEFYRINDPDGSGSPSNRLGNDTRFLSQVWKWLQEGDDFIIGQNGCLNHLSFTQLQSVEAQNPPEDPESNAVINPHIRIYTTEKRIWLALANSDPNPKIVPSMEFQALQIIGTYRDAGIAQSELTKITGQDKRSIPKRTSNLADKGLIEKIPIFMKGHKTSLLRLAKYGKEIGTAWSSAGMTDQIFHGSQFDLDCLVSKIVELSKDGSAISIDTLYNVSGIVSGQQDVWKRRSLSRGLERLEILGVVERFSAPSDLPHLATGKTRYCHCIRLLRQPTKEDRQNAHLVGRVAREEWRSKLGLRRNTKRLVPGESVVDATAGDEANLGVQNTLDQTGTDSLAHPSLANARQDQAGEQTSLDGPQASEAHEENQATAIGDSAIEIDEEQTDEVRRMSSWDPRRHVLQTTRYVITQAGYAGFTSKDARQSVFGEIFYRPTETLLSRITDNWQHSQPPHLRHLAIIRDTLVTKGNAHYVYKDIQAFKAEVDSGKTDWKVILPRNQTFENLPKPKLDKWGFPVRDAAFYEEPSTATITTTAEGFRDPIVRLSKREPHLVKRPGEPDKYDLEWFRRPRRRKTGPGPPNPSRKKRPRRVHPVSLSGPDDASQPNKRQKTDKPVPRPRPAKVVPRQERPPPMSAATIRRNNLQPVPVGRYEVFRVKKKGRPTKNGQPGLVLKFIRKMDEDDQEQEPEVSESASAPRHIVQPPKPLDTVIDPEPPAVEQIEKIDERSPTPIQPSTPDVQPVEKRISLKRKKRGIISFSYSQDPFAAGAALAETPAVVQPVVALKPVVVVPPVLSSPPVNASEAVVATKSSFGPRKSLVPVVVVPRVASKPVATSKPVTPSDPVVVASRVPASEPVAVSPPVAASEPVVVSPPVVASLPPNQALDPTQEPTFSSLPSSTILQSAAPPNNDQGVSEHNLQGRRKRRNIKRKQGINLNTGSARHGKIECAIDLLRKAGGVFGGDIEFVKPFKILWKQRHPEALPPDRLTVNRTFKNAFANGDIKRIGFNFKDEKGNNVTKHLIYLPDTPGMEEPFKSPLGRDTIKKMIKAYPNYYLHPDVEFRSRNRPRVHIDRYHKRDHGFKVVPEAPDGFREELVNPPEAILSLQERKRQRDNAYADQQNRANAPVLIASSALWSHATEARQMFRRSKAKGDKAHQQAQRDMGAIRTGLYDHFSEPIPNMQVWGGPTMMPLPQPEWTEDTRVTEQVSLSTEDEDGRRPSKRRRITLAEAENLAACDREIPVSPPRSSSGDHIHSRSIYGHIFRPTSATETLRQFNHKLTHPVQTFNSHTGTISTDFRIAPETAAYDFEARDPILSVGEKPVLTVPRRRKRTQAALEDAANADDEAESLPQPPPRKRRRKPLLPEDTQEMQDELKEWRASGHRLLFSQDRYRGFVNYTFGHRHQALKPRTLPLKLQPPKLPASGRDLAIVDKPIGNKLTKAGIPKRKPGPKPGGTRPRVRRDSDGKPIRPPKPLRPPKPPRAPKPRRARKSSRSLPQQDQTSQEAIVPPLEDTADTPPPPMQSDRYRDIAARPPNQTPPSLDGLEDEQLVHPPMPWHDGQQSVNPPMPWHYGSQMTYPPMYLQDGQELVDTPMPWQPVSPPLAPEPDSVRTLADLIPVVSDYHPSLLKTTASVEAPTPTVAAPWQQSYVPIDPSLESGPPPDQGALQGVLIPTSLWARRQSKLLAQPRHTQSHTESKTSKPVSQRPKRVDPNCIIDSTAERRLIYGIVVLSELAGGANGYISWKYLDHLLEDHPNYCQVNFKNRWNSVKKTKSHEIQCIREDFRTKFLKAYQEGSVPKVDLRAPQDSDWSVIIEWALKNIQVLAGQRIVPRPGELHKYQYTVTDRSNTVSRDAYGRPSTTNQRRRRIASNFVASVPLHRPKKHKDFERQFIRSWARGAVADRNVSGKYPLAAKMLYSIKNKSLEAAIKDLMVAKQIRKLRGKYFLMDPMKALLNQKRVWKMEDFERAVAYKEKLDHQIKAGTELAAKRAPARAIEDILNAPLSGSDEDQGTILPITVRTHPVTRTSSGISAKKAGKKAKKVVNKTANKKSSKPLTTVGGQTTTSNGPKAADKNLDKVLDGRVTKKRKRQTLKDVPLWRFKPSGEYAELTQYIDDAQAMVVTELCAAHQLRTLPRLPPTINEFGAPWPRLSVYGFAEYSYETKKVPKERFFWDMEIEALDSYEYGMPLTDMVAKTPVPMRPKNDSRTRARLPYWSIFGSDVAIERWIRVLHMIIHRATTGAGVTAKELVVYMKMQLELWEVELAIDWMVEVGVMRRAGSGVSSCGYWWALLPVVKKHWEMQQALKEGMPWAEWKAKYELELQKQALAAAEQTRRVRRPRASRKTEKSATVGAEQAEQTVNGDDTPAVIEGAEQAEQTVNGDDNPAAVEEVDENLTVNA